MRLPYPKRRDYCPAPYSRPEQVAVVEEDDDTDWKNSPDLPPRINEYSFSVDTVGLINHLSKMGKAVQWPPKSSKPDSKKDPSKWCDFHADIGHTTNECVALRREVAYLLKNGYLKDVMSDKARGVVNKDNSNSPSRPPSPPPHTKNSKRHTRENEIDIPAREVAIKHLTPISFDESEAGDISDKHTDGLVISIPVGNCMIRRVLVDNGRSTNVMMLDALKEMGMNPDTDVVKKSTVLIGFSGEAKTTFRELTFPVYAQRVNQKVKLCVIDCPSSYNIIFGRPWIHDMKAIPSNLSLNHQVPNSVVGLGNQRRSIRIQRVLQSGTEAFSHQQILIISTTVQL
ncbi:uncharacterized protein [Spinacia oleracea]|uniref:Retrotransposon gag domain-containing protein n=1 Tax=Spinacia oleracea TaxID=3562 RepID=A0ABM3RQQ6_SPIOL|nr:uncharacterized protein LOC130471702 [Spinacia oleracea]